MHKCCCLFLVVSLGTFIFMVIYERYLHRGTRKGRRSSGVKVGVSPVSGVQDTPASSPRPQLCSPQALLGHCSMGSLLPVQRPSPSTTGQGPPRSRPGPTLWLRR